MRDNRRFSLHRAHGEQVLNFRGSYLADKVILYKKGKIKNAQQDNSNSDISPHIGWLPDDDRQNCR